ncbi:BQ2448_4874 [Microbotryum intermedium]|uniref:BQ2448_4874 protein n=1 Tax=Microbotryum intermedium TaxID=269621 RepID=A0A238FEC5_9BASI|nr:BQ2448_4874 [Microbotryum intermedium]
MSSSSVVADSDPACATALPSAPSGSSLLGSYSATTVTEGPSILRAKTATRTYGKPRPVVDEDVATTTAPDSAATEVQATPGLERVDARLIARKTSLVVVPESDLDLGARDVHRSSSYSSPQNHGSIESRQKAKNMFSPAGRRGHDSTDPTSEEVTGDADATMRQPKDRKIVHEVVAAPSSSQTSTDSDNGDEDDEDGAAAFFKKGNWKDQLAEMDQDDFDFDSLPTVVVEKTTPAADTTLVFSTQSTLTSLPTSDGPVAKVGRVSASARPGVVSDDEEESDEGAARTKSKTQRRVINSDDDSDADAGETFKAGKGRPAVIATSSVEDIDNVEEDALPLSKKKPKGAISKKEEDLMHRETAALRREQDFRLAPRVKSAPKIMDILHKTQHYRPVVAPTRKKFLGPIPSLPTKKAEPAPAPDSPIRGSSPPPRDSSPIEDTPTAIRRQVIIPPTLARSSGPLKSFTAAPVDDDNDDDDDDEELPTLEKVFEEQAKAEERRKYHEHKVAAAKRAEEDRLKRLLSVAPDEEEDSDLEFEVVKPTARSRSERHATPTSDVHRTVHVASVSRSARKIRDLDINIPAQNHDEDDETAAQTALLMRGRGKKPKGWVPRMKSLEPKKTNNAEFDSIEALNDRLLGKSAMKNIDERTRKQVQARRKMEGVVKTDGVAKVNVDHLLKTKDENIKAAKQREEEDEDAEDADWAEEEDEDDDERGSDAESDDEAGSGDEMIEDEAEDDSAAEDEDEEVTPPVVVKRRVRLQSASDEEDDEEETIKNDVNASSPQAIKGVELPSFLDSQPDRGFSQFFDDDVSQAFGEANESGDGFNRRGTQKLAAEETASQEAAREHGLYLTKTQRMADNQALEERAAFAGELSPGTPGPGYDPPPRVYINKEGLMTQTRPLNLFGAASMESPLGLTFSPLDSASRPRFSLDSSSQRPTGMTQTQLAETQTPTQASKDPSRLRRANAVIGYDSISELAATEVEPVSTEVEGFETQETDQQESFPSAAQPTAPNAFEIMRQAAMQQSILPALVEDMQRESRRKDANAFIEQEADLSDEEGGALGRLSGDEDETNLDDELESLVDHDEIAPELAAEQDALVNDLHAQILAKQDADELAKAQAIADGKERNRRKGLDIDDDDFDDDFGISTKRAEKRPRIENFSTAQLRQYLMRRPIVACVWWMLTIRSLGHLAEANEETRPFALNITEGLVTSVRQSDIDYLAEPEGGESGSDDDDEFVDEAGTSDADGEGNSAMAPPPRKISMREANELALERSRRKELERRTSPLLEVRLGNGQSSSPVALPKVKNRALLAKTVVSRPRPSDDFELLDSQYALVNRTSASRVAYNNSGDARDESQGSGKGTTAGKNSAVTSFKRTASNASLVSNRSDGSTGSKKGKALGSTSRAMSFRRNAFET